eukprot:TRINITY_DN35874_c0_g1_i1.p1 TRINITY_DN35874_c0_g1~~TRINITY_DN35874_c0_g1_i1.p1  ORF type:complete len:192 (+),score=51.29 TRINITY_DN35874_c0_g1_i1:67-642(+)
MELEGIRKLMERVRLAAVINPSITERGVGWYVVVVGEVVQARETIQREEMKERAIMKEKLATTPKQALERLRLGDSEWWARMDIEDTRCIMHKKLSQRHACLREALIQHYLRQQAAFCESSNETSERAKIAIRRELEIDYILNHYQEEGLRNIEKKERALKSLCSEEASGRVVVENAILLKVKEMLRKAHV